VRIAGETSANAEVRLGSVQGAAPVEGIDAATRHPSIMTGHPVMAPVRRVLNNLSLGLILAGLTTGVLTLVGGTYLERAAVVADNPWDRCIGFQVGGPHAATTHLHLDNGGRERIDVRFDYLDENGLDSPIQGDIPALDQGVSSDLMFRTPALGAAVRLVSSAKGLRASMTIHRDDGEPAESRRAFLCLAQ